MSTAPSGDNDDESHLTPSPVATGKMSTRPSLRVLVVDDLVDAAESLAILLRKLGHHVRTAHDGYAGLQAAAAFNPHAVLLDLAMPKLNGFEVAKQLRERVDTQLACLIAISGYGQPAYVRSAEQAGFDHHLIKPVHVHEVESILRTISLRSGPE